MAVIATTSASSADPNPKTGPEYTARTSWVRVMGAASPALRASSSSFAAMCGTYSMVASAAPTAATTRYGVTFAGRTPERARAISDAAMIAVPTRAIVWVGTQVGSSSIPMT
ncbi:hypothetical protein BJF87_12215 [Gordonia sp. CNJ-863]|uniref:Uncharacterized protein n=1 Tax=Gordonia alkanivorans CGMCC 6845 TaxID=1423140 RepID=W9DB31_9ACTN|nr:hypothetical protein V525_17595 [Gordonia alkanivorans CGMCC 6845]OLT40483.1 hypothetical protein BJF87_12215 [Gordonia sp. CNJ-863]